MTLVYERIEPEGRCVNPDGHDYIEDSQIGYLIPAWIVCPRCGKEWTVKVFEDGGSK